MDAFGHVNNTVYFRYFEDARIAYFDKIGVHEIKEEL
jgi:acyl-CoA thioester hydrolase